MGGNLLMGDGGGQQAEVDRWRLTGLTGRDLCSHAGLCKSPGWTGSSQ